jgi:hypothetical protein
MQDSYSIHAHHLSRSLILLLGFVFWSCEVPKKRVVSSEASLATRICECEDDLFAFNLEVAKEMAEASKARQKEIIEKGAERMSRMENCVLQAKADLSLMEKELDRALILSKLKLSCQDKPGSFHEKVMLELEQML